jgi:hypothetical protein
MTQSVQEKWIYADHIPWAMPESLDELVGVSSGQMRVRPGIHTAPDMIFDFDDREDWPWMYRSIICDGVAEEQRQLLRKDTLIQMWPTLGLPLQCRAAWEAKFPELRA